MNRAIQAAKQFAGTSHLDTIHEHGGGNVNDTFVVQLKDNTKFILQRLNTRVFKNPEMVIANMCQLNVHSNQLLARVNLPPDRRWEIPQVLHTPSGQNYWIDEDNGFWRAISFISGATAHEKIKDPRHGFEVGFGLGLFQSLISSLPIENLNDTLPGFHVTPNYLERYRSVLKGTHCDQGSNEEKFCHDFISKRASWCSVLEDAAHKGELIQRPIHGDPKTANIMLDDSTGHAVALIDLDTVKPGLVHYDIGDCLRSSCNLSGEEFHDLKSVLFSIPMAKQILKGYLSIASSFFTENDYKYLYDSVRLITFELGLRFFTDHLENNIYFKVKYPRHNLERALIQFKLAESIEAQKDDIIIAINEARVEAKKTGHRELIQDLVAMY